MRISFDAAIIFSAAAGSGRRHPRPASATAPADERHTVAEGSLTKAALVEEVAHVTGLTKKHAETIVDTVFGSIVEALHRGEKVELRGFGSFRRRRREPHRGRNPRTGSVVLSRNDVRCRDAAAILAGRPPRRVGVR